MAAQFLSRLTTPWPIGWIEIIADASSAASCSGAVGSGSYPDSRLPGLELGGGAMVINDYLAPAPRPRLDGKWNATRNCMKCNVSPAEATRVRKHMSVGGTTQVWTQFVHKLKNRSHVRTHVLTDKNNVKPVIVIHRYRFVQRTG
jgi:hypothetical protein